MASQGRAQAQVAAPSQFSRPTTATTPTVATQISREQALTHQKSPGPRSLQKATTARLNLCMSPAMPKSGGALMRSLTKSQTNWDCTK